MIEMPKEVRHQCKDSREGMIEMNEEVRGHPKGESQGWTPVRQAGEKAGKEGFRNGATRGS